MIPHSRPTITGAEIDAIQRAIATGFVKDGQYTRELEASLRQRFRMPVALTVASGTAALTAALRILHPRGKANVAIPSLVCRSVYDAVLLADCTPIVCDISPSYFGIDPHCLAQSDIQALISCHLFGVYAPMSDYVGDITVIEDCAQYINFRNASFYSSPAAAKVLSFEATKLLTCGVGGALCLAEKDLGQSAEHLCKGSYESTAISMWTGLSELQAAMVLAQLEAYESFIARRREIARQYIDALVADFRHCIHEAMFRSDTIFYRFLLLVDNPEIFLENMRVRGVVCRRPVAPLPLHSFFNIRGDFKNTDWIFEHLVSIPIYPSLEEHQVGQIISATLQILPLCSTR